jgi:hypothetical protein
MYGTDQGIGVRGTSFNKLFNKRSKMSHSAWTASIRSGEAREQRQPQMSEQRSEAEDSSRSDLREDDFGFHYEKSYLAKLKGLLAEKLGTRTSEDPPPSAVETSDGSSSDSDCDSSLEERRSPRVQFSSVSIRTYSITVGDTHFPKAYPITLDWEHTQTETLEIGMFEELFSSAQTKPKRKMIRGFRMPGRLSPGRRFDLLATVTGQALEDLHELELARMKRGNPIPITACSSDEGYEEAHTRRHPYQMVDVDEDEYQMVDI